MDIDIIRCMKELTNKISGVDKPYFEQYVEPSWVILNKIHNDYIQSFLKYNDLINTNDFSKSFQELINELENDSTQSSKFRHEIVALVKNMPIKESNKFQNYILFLSYYFKFSFSYFNNDTVKRKAFMISNNIWRSELLQAILDTEDEYNRQLIAASIIAENLVDIQERYAQVADAYHALRASLLR